MGSEKKGGRFGVCNGVGIFTSEETGNGIGEMLTLSRLMVVWDRKAEEGFTVKKDDAEGTALISLVEGRTGGVIVYCKAEDLNGQGQ